ncbi:MAG: hypothetical protein H6721_02890, partial [Sandaracinus sp.]|nr:hypothetical protein [Sandaracinus sp.]
MGDNDEGSLGERLSIPMAGVPVPEDEARAAGDDLLSELEPPEELDLLDPDSEELDDAVDALSISNVPPELPAMATRAMPPRPPLPVRRPAGAAPPQRDRISNEPPVAFPPLPSEPPPGRGSGIDFEKVLATAAMAPPPKPEPAPSLDLVPSVAPMPTVAPEPQRSGGGGRTVLLVVAAAAAAFGLAWWLRAPAASTETLALGPIETAPSSSSVAEVEPDAPEPSTEPSSVVPAAAPTTPTTPTEPTTAAPSEPTTPTVVAPSTTTLATTRPTSPTTTTATTTTSPTS